MDGINGVIKSFSAMKISIGEKFKREFIFNCLEGVFYDDVTEKNYWRVGGHWYEVSCKYTFEVYTEYISVLKASLLNKDDCPLKINWPLKCDRNLPETKSDNFGNQLKIYNRTRFISEGEYNNLYNALPFFIVTDARVVPYGLEICDLFQYIPNPEKKCTIYLHHVKKAFGADGYRCAICQILSSAYSLHNALNCEGEDSTAKKLFDFIQNNSHNSTGFKYANYKEFREQLRNATFVFSPLFDTGERELDKDRMALIKYDFSDFEEKIEPSFREGLKRELESFLLKEEFIHPDGEFTAKWFDSCSVVNDRGFHVQNEMGFFFDPFPGEKYRKLKQKGLRKILKEKYYKTVDALSTKQLIVHMSDALHSTQKQDFRTRFPLSH